MVQKRGGGQGGPYAHCSIQCYHYLLTRLVSKVTRRNTENGLTGSVRPSFYAPEQKEIRRVALARQDSFLLKKSCSQKRYNQKAANMLN
jgi:hypothetical protein